MKVRGQVEDTEQAENLLAKSSKRKRSGVRSKKEIKKNSVDGLVMRESQEKWPSTQEEARSTPSTGSEGGGRWW